MAGRIDSRADVTRTPRTARRPCPARVRRAAQWWRRAVTRSGHERHAALLTGKSALAATLAWFVADHVLHTRSPAFAPFSAVLVMQTTVYQSVLHALRYAGAVVVGVAVQAALCLVLGPGLVAFALVALVALGIGRWARLGSQGIQVPTAAFFAFATYVAASGAADRLADLGEIVLLVLTGCALATALHVTVVPPMRHRSAEFGIGVLAHALAELLADVAHALREGEAGERGGVRRRRRVDHTDALIAQARADLRTARDSVSLNPRRLLRAHREHTSFDGYATVLEALVRTLYQVASLHRALDRWHEDQNQYEDQEFLRGYARLLDALREYARVLSDLDAARLPAQARQLRRLTGEAGELRRALADEAVRRELPLGDPSCPYGVLVVEATRLWEECRRGSEALRRWARG
ncbi:FUSC family protein [Streptomyces sp. G45]|uniref:FUSC family protein n=1 Tax=Streptomyces sp. G45 TaxID=3406627 RepID=UPI003C1F9B02